MASLRKIMIAGALAAGAAGSAHAYDIKNIPDVARSQPDAVLSNDQGTIILRGVPADSALECMNGYGVMPNLTKSGDYSMVSVSPRGNSGEQKVIVNVNGKLAARFEGGVQKPSGVIGDVKRMANGQLLSNAVGIDASGTAFGADFKLYGSAQAQQMTAAASECVGRVAHAGTAPVATTAPSVKTSGAKQAIRGLDDRKPIETPTERQRIEVPKERQAVFVPTTRKALTLDF